jgi:outer membrane protein, heavy metal efflux system
MYRRNRQTSSTIALVFVMLVAARTGRTQPAPVPAPVASVTIGQAVDLALHFNHTLLAQRFNVDQAKANEVTASLKPNPVFTSTNQDFPVFTPSSLTWNNVATTQSFTEAFSYVFERGGKRDHRVRVARDTTEMTARTVEDAERQMRFQVQQAFVNVLLARSTLGFAREDLDAFSRVVALNKERLDRGDLAEGDFVKISLQKLQFEQDVTGAEAALVQARAALRQLVGFGALTADFDVVGELAHRAVSLTLADLQRDALAARPDMNAARVGTRLAASSAELAHSNRARDFTGEVEYDRVGPVNALGWGFSFELPFHDRNQGEIARTEVAVKQARETEAAAETTVVTDVVNAFSGFQASEKALSLYESGYLAQAQQSREISSYAYLRGAGSLLDLLDAERTYRATQLAYRQALASHMISLAQLDFAVGKQVFP